MLCRFVPDGVVKAEKVRDGSQFFHPEYHHHPRVALYNPDPEVNLVKRSSERAGLYVLFRYRSTYPPHPLPYPSGTFPLFPFPGSADGFGTADQRDVFVSALSIQAGTEGWFPDVISSYGEGSVESVVELVPTLVLDLAISGHRTPVALSCFCCPCSALPASLRLLPSSCLFLCVCQDFLLNPTLLLMSTIPRNIVEDPSSVHCVRSPQRFGAPQVRFTKRRSSKKFPCRPTSNASPS